MKQVHLPVHIHPNFAILIVFIADSGLHSELTSDEEPDLGALRRFCANGHIYTASKNSCTNTLRYELHNTTFQLSATGSEAPDNRSNSRRVTSQSIVSSFTRPPSSSAHRRALRFGLMHPLLCISIVAPQITTTKRNESYESTGMEGEYTPNSTVSTDLTVEIASETDFEQSNGRVASPPYPYPSDSGITLPLTLDIGQQSA